MPARAPRQLDGGREATSVLDEEDGAVARRVVLVAAAVLDNAALAREGAQEGLSEEEAVA